MQGQSTGRGQCLGKAGLQIGHVRGLKGPGLGNGQGQGLSPESGHSQVRAEQDRGSSRSRVRLQPGFRQDRPGLRSLPRVRPTLRRPRPTLRPGVRDCGSDGEGTGSFGPGSGDLVARCVFGELPVLGRLEQRQILKKLEIKSKYVLCWK